MSDIADICLHTIKNADLSKYLENTYKFLWFSERQFDIVGRIPISIELSLESLDLFLYTGTTSANSKSCRNNKDCSKQ